jgi:hypothetical protein
MASNTVQLPQRGHAQLPGMPLGGAMSPPQPPVRRKRLQHSSQHSKLWSLMLNIYHRLVVATREGKRPTLQFQTTCNLQTDIFFTPCICSMCHCNPRSQPLLISYAGTMQVQSSANINHNYTLCIEVHCCCSCCCCCLLSTSPAELLTTTLRRAKQFVHQNAACTLLLLAHLHLAFVRRLRSLAPTKTKHNMCSSTLTKS